MTIKEATQLLEMINQNQIILLKQLLTNELYIKSLSTTCCRE